MSLPGFSLTLIALLAGGFIALQAPINAEAAARLGHPLTAATMSFCVGTVALIVLTALFARNDTHLEAFKSMPLYMLLGGGLLGAVYVTVNLMLAPRIGVAAVMALGIAGQLFTALLVDRLGLFALMERGLTFGRVSGALLVLVGALMVRSL
ncbi:MAG: DMT family transporter [Methyloceanibacter sp.]|jgi:bacterial/archaeal transporter family-2 protein|nr:DMT family transporter [Methyloceanibacter sp.]